MYIDHFSVSVTPEGGGAAQSEPALPPLLPHPSLAGRLHLRQIVMISFLFPMHIIWIAYDFVRFLIDSM